MVFMLPMAYATKVFRDMARKVTRQGSRAMAAVNDTIQETVTGRKKPINTSFSFNR
jgi:hypothetical protein